VEFSAWLSLATICILGVMTPGQSFIVILRHSLAGRINGLTASLAHGLGVALYAMLTVTGLAIIIQQTPWLFNLIKYFGVAFLLFLAYKALASKAADTKFSVQKTRVPLCQSFSEGLMVAFLNPKLAIFFLALFSQFVDAQGGWQKNLIITSTVACIDTLWYCLISLLLSHPVIMSTLRSNLHIIEKLTGIALLAVALKVAV